MTTLRVEHSYTVTHTGEIELPDGKTWDDVEDWYIKWCTMHIKFQGNEKWHEIELDTVDPSDGDYKRPDRSAIFNPDESMPLDEHE